MVGHRGSTPDIGLIWVMVNVPEPAKRGENFGVYTRGDACSLPPNTRDMDCHFIGTTHSAFGGQSGLRDELVNKLSDKKELPSLSAEKSVGINYGPELSRTGKVSQVNYDATNTLLATSGLLDPTNLMGHHSDPSLNIRSFDLGLPDNTTTAPLPI